MSIVNFDLEATGLPVYSDLTAAAWKVSGSLCEEIQFTKDPAVLIDILVETMREGHPIAGHNIVCYDLPLLVYWERNTRRRSSLMMEIFKDDTLIVDTLLLSRKHFLNYTSHSMDSWVDRLILEGYEIPAKPEIEDWENATDEDLRERVICDVLIQEAITDFFVHQNGLLDNIANYNNIMKCQACIIDLMANGVPYDSQTGQEKAVRLSNYMDIQEGKMARDFGEINPLSSKQIDEALFELYGERLPYGAPSKKLGKRSPQIGQKNKNYLSNKYPELRSIFKWRDAKGQLDYLKKDKDSKKSFDNNVRFSKYFKKDTIHPALSLFSSRTQRSQFSSPPLNQLSKKVREMIAAPEGECFLGADIEALELKVLGTAMQELFGEDSILRSIEEGKDPKDHTIACLQEAFDEVARLDPSKDLRDLAKKTNYAFLFGQNPKNLCYVTLGIDQDFVPGVREGLEKRFPGMDDFLKLLQGEIEQYGYLKNYYGLEVASPGYCSINSFVQSTGAEYALMVLSLFFKQLRIRLDHHVHPVIFNHDELDLLVNCTLQEAFQDADQTVKDIMKNLPRTFEDTYQTKFIAGLDYSWGLNWADVH